MTAALFRPRLLALATTLAALLPLLPQQALAGATLPFGDGESLSIGLAMRGSFTSTSNAAPNGSDRSADFALDSVRLLMGATLSPNIKAVFNTERDSNGHINLLDGFAAFEFDPAFNVWAGRILPPSDRANLDGPYYQAAFDYPGVASGYYSKSVGRDDGVTAWGVLGNKALVYSAGVFQGRNHDAGVGATTSNQKASPLYAARVAYNFLNPEPAPAYLEGSTYYGGAGTILTVGLAGMNQSDGVGSVTTAASYKAYNADVLFELPLAGGGALDLGGAYYKYDYPVAAYSADVTAGSGITPPGKAYMAEAEYLFGDKVGVGRFQPFLRYQKYDLDSGGSNKRSEVGVNYIIKGADARLAAFYVHDELAAQPSSNTIRIAYQLQF